MIAKEKQRYLPPRKKNEKEKNSGHGISATCRKQAYREVQVDQRDIARRYAKKS